MTEPKKITKSRTGCLTCKKKRLKCDEGKPECKNCKNKKILCGGYATNFKWRSFNDSDHNGVILQSASSTPNSGGTVPTGTLKRHMELATLSMTGKSMLDIKIENALISQGLNPETYKKRKRSKSVLVLPDIGALTIPIKQGRSSHLIQRSNSTNSFSQPSDLQSLRLEFKGDLHSLAEVAVEEINKLPVDSPSMTPLEIKKVVPNSPFSDFFGSESGKRENPELTPSISALINFAFGSEPAAMSPLTLSHIEEQNMASSMLPDVLIPSMRSSNSTPMLDEDFSVNKIFLSSSSSLLSPDSDLNRLLLHSSEQQQILHLYYQYTCLIMSIKNGADENPWRSMIIPLALKYACLYNSIASMTLFHLAGHADLVSTSGNLRARGFMFMKRCVMDLASGLSQGSNDIELPADIALATCLNLAVSESWDTQISSGIAHLKGARSMIQKVLTLLKDQQLGLKSKRKKFLTSEMSPSEYSAAIAIKKHDMQQKLVLLDNNEWDSMLSAVDEEVNNSSAISIAIIPKSVQFLFNIWIYFEVLAQMTTETNHDDKGIDLVATITTMLEKSKVHRHLRSSRTNSESGTNESPSIHSDLSSESGVPGVSSTPGYSNLFDNFETFSNYTSNTEYVDPLLGCSQLLFLIMGKVANLILKIRKLRLSPSTRKKHNSLSTITTATQVKQQLIDWKPTITAQMVNSSYSDNEGGVGSTWDISLCIATAEAYRFASILYLHQAVPEIPSLLSHQLAEKIFILMALIPTTSHLYVVHIFPLLLSSCEAEPGEEREWCEARWLLLSQKMWIGNIDRAYEVVKEVWRRKDEHRRKRNANPDEKFGEEDERLRNISSQISGLMAVVNSEQNSAQFDDITGGIASRLHWSAVMKEWGWEVLLG